MREVQIKVSQSKVVRERYVVEELLGQGGFGAVYRVHDRRVKNNIFALKEIANPNRHQRESFLFEGELLRRLDHPSLPRVYRLFEDEKYCRLYMLMDYVDGPNLERLRVRQPERRFTWPVAMRIMTPIIEAVRYLHTQNPPIIHRDIKPANIIVLASGEGAALVDFGIAKVYDLDATTTAVRHCSPGYGAPEQYMRDTSQRTDIYGLGATFYTLLTGEVPIDSLYRITGLTGRSKDPLVPICDLAPDVPPAVAEIIERAMAINSQERFASVEAFLEALKEYDCEKITDGLPLDIRPDVVEPVPPPESVLSTGSAMGVLFQPWRQLWHIGQRRGQLFFVGCLALAILALSSGAIFASGHWFYTSNGVHNMSVVNDPFNSADHPRALPPDGPSDPHLLSKYNGDIHNTPINIASTMSLLKLHQTGSAIYGYFMVGPGLIGSGNFTGSIVDRTRVQFLVLAEAQVLPLFFEGSLHTDGSISGSYCSYQNYRCNYAGGGYGQWRVVPRSE